MSLGTNDVGLGIGNRIFHADFACQHHGQKRSTRRIKVHAWVIMHDGGMPSPLAKTCVNNNGRVEGSLESWSLEGSTLAQTEVGHGAIESSSAWIVRMEGEAQTSIPHEVSIAEHDEMCISAGSASLQSSLKVRLEAFSTIFEQGRLPYRREVRQGLGVCPKVA